MERPTVREYAAMLRRGELRCRDLIDAALARRSSSSAYRSSDDARCVMQAEAVDQALRAGVDLGPWMGIPISVKDLFGVPGFPTCAGTPNPLPAAWERPGPIVRALLQQQAIVVGKTETVEFAFGGLGTNPHRPPLANPWDPKTARVPGGSSAGAGVSLCEGSALLALGTDTAGSVRIPASFTGTFGLKTTHGRWSLDGIVPLSPTLDSVGLLANNIEDLTLAFATLDGRRRHRPLTSRPSGGRGVADLRLGRVDELLWDDCSPGIVETVETALWRLTAAGAMMTPLALPEVRLAYDLFRQGGPVAAELHHFLSSELPEAFDTLDPNVAQRVQSGGTLTASEYLGRLARLRAWSAAAEARMADVDAWVAPTVALTPPPLEEVAGDGYASRNLLALRNPSVVNYLGMCALTIPVGLDAAGMPVGMMVVGRRGADEDLVAIANVIAPRVCANLPACPSPPM